MISDIPQPGVDPTKLYLWDLLNTEWDLSDSRICLSSDLTLTDLTTAPFLLNSRIFLQALLENDGAPVTATGNLNRTFVGPMLDRLVLPKTYRESTRTVSKVINERDLWPLHLARIVTGLAKLVRRQNKHFRLTKKGRDLLSENHAGELYRCLFLTYFRRFNLRYDFGFRDVPLIQQAMATILWRLWLLAEDWIPVTGLAPKILLLDVLLQLRQSMVSEFDTEEWILAGYVLNPLADFGLIETQKPRDCRLVADTDVIRITPLWRKFIVFK